MEINTKVLCFVCFLLLNGNLKKKCAQWKVKSPVTIRHCLMKITNGDSCAISPRDVHFVNYRVYSLFAITLDVIPEVIITLV